MATQAQNNALAYNAAIVTRDRALQNRLDSIDIMQRLLAQMDDDPLVAQTQKNLLAILENPEIITDEVFNNIMSKNAEVLDSNYDTQVQQVLGAARSKGVSGPALQITLQRAKEGRAANIAAAYRDAIIERASSGLKTNMEAIAASTTLLNNLFSQKRVATEGLVNVMNTLVEEPAMNYGIDLPQEGGGAGSSLAKGNTRPITMDFSGVDPNWGAADPDMLARAAEWRGEGAGADKTVYGNQPDGSPGTAASQAAAEAAANQAWAAANGATRGTAPAPGTPGLPVPLSDGSPKPGTGTFEMNGKKYFMENGRITEVTPGVTPGASTPLGSPASSGFAARSTPLPAETTVQPYPTAYPVPKAAASPATTIQSLTKAATSGISGLGAQIAQNFAPSTSTLRAPTVIKTNLPWTEGGAYGSNYSESTISPSSGGSISGGGGAAGAAWGEKLVKTYGADNVIGTTAGYGVRKSATPASRQTPTGSASPGASLAEAYKAPTGGATSSRTAPSDPYANASNTGYRTSAKPASSQPSGTQHPEDDPNFLGWGYTNLAGQKPRKAKKVNTGVGENFGKSWMYVPVE